MTNDPDQIVYFPDEGKAHLDDCLNLSFATAASYGIGKIVIFTARGDGIHLAIKRCAEDPGYKEIKVVGVSFPQGQTFTDPKEPKKQIRVEINHQSQKAFKKANIPIIRAHLPFDSIAARFRDHGVLGRGSEPDWERSQYFWGWHEPMHSSIAYRMRCRRGFLRGTRNRNDR